MDLYFLIPGVASVVVGLVAGRLWILLIPLALGLIVWISAENDGDGEIPGWFLGLITAGSIGIGALLGLLLRWGVWGKSRSR